MEDGAEVRGLDSQHKGDEDPGGEDGRGGAKAEVERGRCSGLACWLQRPGSDDANHLSL